MSHSNLLEKELDELYKEADRGRTEGERAGNVRRLVAYILKVIAAGGSLVVATGLFSDWHQQLGIAVLVAIFFDTVSSNHKKLLATVEAGYAFRALKSKVKREFNREASTLYTRKNKGEDVDDQIDILMKEAHVALSEGIELIQRKKEASDIDALKALSLDQERAGMSPN
ncbi:hypothetical protein [Pseudoalteromonas sp. R3]|uniref:hypothetical protein n=1 Tax=Pseudoalteromonas sp. R3 TaxID=1709477 RepID=UPI0006B4497C|nr:hypothetical protein [Pseudoalteromonas sp. R3]AZZ98465.1 hypothetical protein ELR70_15910 [Pseudoalteromonas sp. R3]